MKCDTEISGFEPALPGAAPATHLWAAVVTFQWGYDVDVIPFIVEATSYTDAVKIANGCVQRLKG